MSEWGNPHEQTSCILQPIHNCRKGTRGTETSKYPEEKKENSILQVAASEMERGQTGMRAFRGYGLHLRFFEANRTVLGKPAGEGESPVRES